MSDKKEYFIEKLSTKILPTAFCPHKEKYTWQLEALFQVIKN